MTAKKKFTPHAWSTALLTIGLSAALVFGTSVLIGGDWIPGAVIVAASMVGLIRTIRALRRHLPPGNAAG